MSSLNSSIDVCGQPIPKWVLLATGVAVTGGVAYFGYKNINQVKTNSKNEVQGVKSKEKSSLDITKGSGNVIEELKAKGNDLFKQKKYNEAIEFYTKGIALCPSDEKKSLSALYQNRAAAYENLSKYDKVLEDTNKALEINSNYVKAIARRAKAHEQLGKLDLALQDFTACCIFESFGNQATLMSADRVLKALGAQHAKEELSKRSFFIPSKQFIKTYLKSFPNDPILHKSEIPMSNGVEYDGPHEDYRHSSCIVKAKKAFEKEDYLGAIKLCTEELDSTNASSTEHIKALAKLLRASMYIFTAQSVLAFEDLNVLISDPKIDSKVKVNALIKRAAAHLYISSDFEKAFADLDEVEKVNPDIADSYYQRGQIFCLFGKYDEALQNFEKTTKLNPNFIIAQAQKLFVAHRKAIQETNSQQIEETLKEFKLFLNNHDDCVEACTLYAQILMEVQDYSGADEYFKRSIQIEPQNASIYVHRALMALQAKGDIDEAVKLIEQAISIDKSCLFAFETMGTIEVQRGRLKEAIQYFDKAIPLAKDEAELSHCYSLRNAAVAQLNVCEKYNIKVPNV